MRDSVNNNERGREKPALPDRLEKTAGQGAAFFDLDGTLIRDPSAEMRFIWYLLAKKHIGLREVSRTIAGIALNSFGGFYRAVLLNKYYLEGRRAEEIEKIAVDFYREAVSPAITGAAMDKVKEHRLKGEKVILITGAPYFLARLAAEDFGFDDWTAASLDVRGGAFTGRVKGLYPHGKNKVRAMDLFLEKYSLDRRMCAAYGDRYIDRFILGHAGRAVAVNPDYPLKILSARKKWEVIRL